MIVFHLRICIWRIMTALFCIGNEVKSTHVCFQMGLANALLAQLNHIDFAQHVPPCPIWRSRNPGVCKFPHSPEPVGDGENLQYLTIRFITQIAKP